MSDKKEFEIISLKNDIVLRTINENDLELLRVWKNDNREYFFYKNIINPEEQVLWFKGYKNRKNDYILVILYEDNLIGCAGYRLIEDNQIDLYNIILSNKEFGGRGIMGESIRLLCSYILDNFAGEISLKVLAGNLKAIKWYNDNGFVELYDKENYTFMKLDTGNFSYLKYNLKIMN
jgi:RimJ/RimL family protein N-acetyltransferase